MSKVRLGGAAVVVAFVGWCSAAMAAPSSAHHARGHEGVFWFMHLSDAHVGKEFYQGGEGAEALKFALGEGVKVVGPKFVLVSGDLTDGSGNFLPMSGQSDDEWELYRQVYSQAGMTAGFYYDLPGNHDAVGDKGLTHYLKYSLQGAKNNRLYVDWSVKTSVGEYYFFGLNSNSDYFKPLTNCCPAFTQDEITALKNGVAAHKSAELTFVTAHHALTAPSVGIGTPENADVVRGVIKQAGGFYLHGDVHAYKEYLDNGVVVNEVNSIGKSKKSNIAVGVVDHNAFIYRATDLERPWPFVVITSPVSTQLRDDGKNPYAYSVCKDRKDNPVRALVFSKDKPSKVQVTIGSQAAVPMVASKEVANLWEAELDTTKLPVGEVSLNVLATVGSTTSLDEIPVSLVAGPCKALPGDLADGGVPDAATDAAIEGGQDATPGDASSDAGADGAADAGLDSSTDAALDSGAADAAVDVADEAKDSAVVDAGGKDSNASDAPVIVAEEDGAAEGGGCSCRTAESVPVQPGWWAMGIFGMALAVMRRRRQ